MITRKIHRGSTSGHRHMPCLSEYAAISHETETRIYKWYIIKFKIFRKAKKKKTFDKENL